MITPENGYFLVEIDTSQDDFVYANNGERTKFAMMENSTFEKYQNRNQVATIFRCPSIKSELKEGYKVFIKHFAADDDFKQEIGDKIYYRVHYDSIYAYEKDGEIIALHDYFFTTLNGVVMFVSNQTAYLKKGDKVIIMPNGMYPMYINGQPMYRVKERFLIAMVETLSEQIFPIPSGVNYHLN